MSVAKGKVNAGSTFFGLYLPFRFPLFPRRYAVYVEGKRYRVDKQCDPFVGEPIMKLAGHEVEVVISQNEIYAIRDLEHVEPELEKIILFCYLMPLGRAFPDEVIKGIQPLMNEILVKQGVILADDVKIAEQWQSQAMEHG
jgi:hypothetical protein